MKEAVGSRLDQHVEIGAGSVIAARHGTKDPGAVDGVAGEQFSYPIAVSLQQLTGSHSVDQPRLEPKTCRSE